MTSRILKSGIILVFAVSPALAQYQFYLRDPLVSVNAAKWATAGTVSATATGLTAPTAAGGSLVSKIPIPDGTSEAEVDMTIVLKASGGTYTEFLQAAPTAQTAASISAAAAGNYLAFEMENPTIDATAKTCGADFVVLQSVNGVTRAVAAFRHDCADGMVMRMAVHSGTLLVWPNQSTPMEFQIAAFGTGASGIGAYSTPAGNAISQVQIGLINRLVPNAIAAGKLKTTIFRNRVELHWSAPLPIAASRGIAAYWVLSRRRVPRPHHGRKLLR